MRDVRQSPWLKGLGLTLGVLGLWIGSAMATVSTDQSGSIVIYPKVIADGTRDTLIELANTSNLTRYVHCIYINGAGTCQLAPDVLCEVDSDCPNFAAGERCQFIWQEANFGLTLTRQQPTVWQVSTGRIVDVSDPTNGDCSNTCAVSGAPCGIGHPSCAPGDTCRGSCPGIDPGNVIPAPAQPFRGELKCVQVDESDTPNAGDSLKGEAVINTPPTGQISKYNSINFQARAVDSDLALELNNSEYDACPSALEFTHYSDLAEDLVTGNLNSSLCGAPGLCSGGSNPGAVCSTNGQCLAGGTCQFCPVRTEITLVPCTENIEDQTPVTVNALFTVYDEQESPQSANEPVTCWFNQDLRNVGDQGVAFRASRGTLLKTRVQTAGTICVAGANVSAPCASDDDCGGAANGGVCGPAPGLLGIVEEFHETDGSIANATAALRATAASNVHMIGGRTGRCRGTLTSCSSDSDCPQGFCRRDGAACGGNGDCDNSNSTSGLNNCERCLMDTISIPELVPFPAPTPP